MENDICLNSKGQVLVVEHGTICGHYQDGHYILMRSTGLYDDNGKEIFEGDICVFETSIPKLNGIGFVYWNDAGACWSARTTLPFLLHKAVSIKIIGNIYENPELLKGVRL